MQNITPLTELPAGTRVIVGAEDGKTALAFRNIPGVRTMEARNLNALDLLGVKYVLLGKADAKMLSGRVAVK